MVIINPRLSQFKNFDNVIIQKWNGGILNFNINDIRIIKFIIKILLLRILIDSDNIKIEDEIIWIRK